jgi:hypothetical protein
MAYAPINTQAYVSAFAGAIAGMAVSGWIVDPTSSRYAEVAAIAGAFAEAFDQGWNSATDLNNFEVRAIVTVCQNEFEGRGPGSLDNPVFSQASNWAIPALACVALVLEGDAYLAGQGINPGTGGGASSPVASFFAEVADASLEPAINGTFYTAPEGGDGWYRMSAVLRPADITTDAQVAGFLPYVGPAQTQIPLFQFRASSEGGLASAILVPADFYLAEGETIEVSSSGVNVIVGLRLEVVQLGP